MKTSRSHTYIVLYKGSYTPIEIDNIWEIRFERDFVILMDATGPKQILQSDALSKITRKGS